MIPVPKKPVDIDKMLAESEKGRGPKNLKEQNQMAQGVPKSAPLFTAPMGPRGGQIPHKDYAPSNISPHGDLGILDDKEQRAFFPRAIKNANAEWQSSKHFAPVGKPRIACDASYTYGRIKAASSIYGEHDKGDYSGLKAGSKVATQRRGVPAMTNQPINTAFKGKGMAPLANRKMRNV